MSTRCQEETHQRGNLPERVLSLRHEPWSISAVLLSNRGVGGPALSPVRGFPWVGKKQILPNVGKKQSEPLRSRLPNGVAVYRSVLQGRWENKRCQPWRAQVLKARCLLKINGRGGKKKKRQAGKESSDLPVFMMKEMRILARIVLPVHPPHRVTHAFSPFVAGGRSVQS